MNTKKRVAALNTKPSNRWYYLNKDKHKVGVVNQMERVSTGSRARPKVRYTPEQENAILAAL